MLAEYARLYGGAPRPEQPWHEVIALVQRAERFEVREIILAARGTAMGQPISEKVLGQRALLEAKLHDIAYPGRRH